MRARQLLLELTNALRTVSERWLIVGICAAVGLGVGAGAVLLATPMYQGTSTVTVSFRDIEQGNETDQELFLSKHQLRAFAGVAERPQVTERVLELVPDADAETPSELSERVTARVLPNSHLLELSVLDPNPEVAGQLAGASGSVLADQVAELDSPQVSATASDVAEVDGPEVPPVLPWLGLGLVFGALAGAAGLLIAERMDPSIRSASALSAATEVPNLAVIAADSSADLEPTILRLRPSVPRCEEFRQLRSSLQFVDRGRPHRRLLVTSAGPREGRSTTACNLALTMARAGQRVVLLEGDLNAPRLGGYLGLDEQRGLTGVLIGRDEPESVLQSVPDVGPGRLEVMVAGSVPSDPASTSELLRSRAIKFVFQALDQRADVTIVDAPALSTGPEAVALASRCDVTMLVVRHGHTSRRALRNALTSVVDPGVRLLGTVLVMAPRPSSGASGSETSTEYPAVGTEASLAETSREPQAGWGEAAVGAGGSGAGRAGAGGAGAGGAEPGQSARGDGLAVVGGRRSSGVGESRGGPFGAVAGAGGDRAYGDDRIGSDTEEEPTISSRSSRSGRPHRQSAARDFAAEEQATGYAEATRYAEPAGFPRADDRHRSEEPTYRRDAPYPREADYPGDATYPEWSGNTGRGRSDASETTVYSGVPGHSHHPERPERPAYPDRSPSTRPPEPEPARWSDRSSAPQFDPRAEPRRPSASERRGGYQDSPGYDATPGYPDPVSYFGTGSSGSDRTARPGYEQPRYEQSGYDESGYEQHGYDQPRYERRRYQQSGREQPRYERPGDGQGGYRQQGYPPGEDDGRSGYGSGGYRSPGARSPEPGYGRPEDPYAQPRPFAYDDAGYPAGSSTYPGDTADQPYYPEFDQGGHRARPSDPTADPNADPAPTGQRGQRPHRGGPPGRRRKR